MFPPPSTSNVTPPPWPRLLDMSNRRRCQLTVSLAVPVCSVAMGVQTTVAGLLWWWGKHKNVPILRQDIYFSLVSLDIKYRHLGSSLSTFRPVDDTQRGLMYETIRVSAQQRLQGEKVQRVVGHGRTHATLIQQTRVHVPWNQTSPMFPEPHRVVFVSKLKQSAVSCLSRVRKAAGRFWRIRHWRDSP